MDGTWQGGWEDDETMKEAAHREAVEEAGIHGKIMGKSLGKWKYRKIGSDGVFNEWSMFALYVTEELRQWPEIRRRMWVRTCLSKSACMCMENRCMYINFFLEME